jgi:hypothetical protein
MDGKRTENMTEAKPGGGRMEGRRGWVILNWI